MTTHRFRIVHTTSLTYTGSVTSSHNELRMTPMSEDGQVTLESRLRVKPMTWSHVYRDYWGTHVTALEALENHASMDIESISTVERSDVEAPDHHHLSWDDYQLDALHDQLYEYLTPSARTCLDADLLDDFRTEVEGLSPAEAVEKACRTAHDRLAYRRGISNVADGAQQAWDAQAGVCQDITHVTIALIRSLGIPARYVSGYVCPQQDLPLGDSATGESHAWLEWWDGAWFGEDPTSLREVALDHVVVARGRDYQDVPPMKGVFQGFAESDLKVTVTFWRLS